MYTRVHLSVPVSKGTALGKGTPSDPTVYRHVAEARNPHIGCSGLWKAEAACTVLARPPVDTA